MSYHNNKWRFSAFKPSIYTYTVKVLTCSDDIIVANLMYTIIVQISGRIRSRVLGTLLSENFALDQLICIDQVYHSE